MRTLAAIAVALTLAGCGCSDAEKELARATQAANICKMKLRLGRLEMQNHGELRSGVLSCDGEEQELRLAEAGYVKSCR